MLLFLRLFYLLTQSVSVIASRVNSSLTSHTLLHVDSSQVKAMYRHVCLFQVAMEE